MKNKMKSACYYLLIAFAVFLPLACERGGEGIPEPEEPSLITPLVRPVGTPNGTAVTKSIGAAGGSLQSADGKIKVEIPQGALASNTVVGIEPVTNTNIAGIGTAFRLTPHGQVFSKPVTITYAWSSYADSVGLSQTLGLAYQMEDGVWKYVGADSFDNQAKTVTFKSKHFSDWSLMNRITLSPYRADLETGEKLTIKALIFTQAEWEDLLAPLVDNPSGPYSEPGYPVGTPAPLPTKFIKAWELNGPGNLTKSTQQTVEYKAPGSVNGSASATVTMELNAPVAGKFMLVCAIEITDGWIELSINGAKPVRFPASPVVKYGSRYLLANPEDEGGGYFLLAWNGGVGSHAYDLSNSGTYFHFLPPGNAYTSRYIPNDFSDILPSGGSVNITELGNGKVEGNFTVTNVGVGDKLRPLASASGRFKAKLATM